MNLLKNTLFIAFLLFFSLKFSKCQATGEEYSPISEEAVIEACFEKTVVEEALIGCQDVPYTEEESLYEDDMIVGCLEDTQWTENSVIEEPDVEECQPVPEDFFEEGNEDCPQFIEEAEVNGHWMTFHPCCVSSETVCSDWYEPVCVEELRCEADHCRRHYETVTNVCLACKGQGNWMYSIGKCPWERNNQYFRG